MGLDHVEILSSYETGDDRLNYGRAKVVRREFNVERLGSLDRLVTSFPGEENTLITRSVATLLRRKLGQRPTVIQANGRTGNN